MWTHRGNGESFCIERVHTHITRPITQSVREEESHCLGILQPEKVSNVADKLAVCGGVWIDACFHISTVSQDGRTDADGAHTLVYSCLFELAGCRGE